MNPEDIANMTPEQFKQEFAVGTHIEYQGYEYVLIKLIDDSENPTFKGVRIGQGNSFSLNELKNETFVKHPTPSKLPQGKAPHPPQVFVLTYMQVGHRNCAIFPDLKALMEADKTVESDHVVEAISDPGAVVEMPDNRTLTYVAIETTPPKGAA